MSDSRECQLSSASWIISQAIQIYRWFNGLSNEKPLFGDEEDEATPSPYAINLLGHTVVMANTTPPVAFCRHTLSLRITSHSTRCAPADHPVRRQARSSIDVLPSLLKLHLSANHRHRPPRPKTGLAALQMVLQARYRFPILAVPLTNSDCQPAPAR